jgi:MFS family permease
LAPRWRVVIALFCVVVAVATPVSAFGVFLPVLSGAFGWSRGAVSVALSINMLMGGVAAFAVAGAADRRGPRGVLALTVAVGAAGLALCSAIGALWHFYLSYGVLVGIGFSSIYVLTTATVSRWFVERRGLALAVVLSAFNVGWLGGGPIAAALIEHWGWRTAYVVLGCAVAAVGVPAALGVRFPDHVDAPADRPQRHVEVRASFRSALANPRLWYLEAAWFLTGLVFMMTTVHSVPYARDQGLPLERASFLLSAYGVGSGVGRLSAGVLADRFGTSATMYACVTLQALAVVALVSGPPTWALIAVLVAFGAGAAGADMAVVKVVPEVFGVAALATVMSVLSFGWRTGAALGPAGAGFLYDLTRSYTIPFTSGLLLLGVSVLLFRLVVQPGAPGESRR